MQNQGISKDRQEWNQLFNQKAEREIKNESDRNEYYNNVNMKMN